LNRLWIILIAFSLLFLLVPSFVGAAKEDPTSVRPDIIIDVGHGGIDGGTSVNGILEKDINLAVGLKLFHQLGKASYHVGITRIDDCTLSDDSPFPKLSRHLRDLKQRKLIADELNPKLFLSLHVNWSKNKELRGPIVIYQVKEESLHFAHTLQEHLNDFYGVKKYSMKGKPYYLMRYLQVPAVIVELGYLSNPKDFDILTGENTQDELVRAMVKAMDEYFFLYPDAENVE